MPERNRNHWVKKRILDYSSRVNRLSPPRSTSEELLIEIYDSLIRHNARLLEKHPVLSDHP